MPLCAVFSRRKERGREECARMAGQCLLPVCAPVHGPPGLYPRAQWVRASFYYIGHISGKKDHDLEEIMVVVEVVSP